MSGSGKQYGVQAHVQAHSGADRLWASQIRVPEEFWCYHKLTKSVTAAGQLQEVSVHTLCGCLFCL